MASVDTDDVVQLLREFLDTARGERFAITNQSLLDFTAFAAAEVQKGRSLEYLRKRARQAREFAIRSALDGNSTIRVGDQTMPLLRERDAGNTTRNCDSFSEF